MRLCTFLDGGRTHLGSVRGDMVHPLDGRDVGDALAGLPAESGDPRPLEGLRLGPPLIPGKLLGIGHNYRAHALERGVAIPTEPAVFTKLVTSVVGPRDDIVRPAFTQALDYEGELAVVIGRRAKEVAEVDALAHVFGYAVMNDVTARDRQRTDAQWTRAKGADTFGPFGPWITTADEVPDPQALRVRTWVGDELRQDGSTADMLFGVAELIAWCSANFTLMPGDVISTGTPSGVGEARDPQAFLQPGDRIRVEVEGLGALDNRVR